MSSNNSKADFSHNEDLKQDLSHVEQQRSTPGDLDEGFDPAEVKRVTKKIDRRLIPVLSMMYAISLIDRTNLAIARAANNNHMDKELGTGGDNDRYSIITLTFFVPYIIFELPVSEGGKDETYARLVSIVMMLTRNSRSLVSASLAPAGGSAQLSFSGELS